MKEYRVAQISDDTREEIVRLERRIQNETQQDIVLIAYEMEQVDR